MPNQLVLEACSSDVSQYVELVLKVQDPQFAVLTANWEVTLPPNLEPIPNSRELKGESRVLPTDSSVVLARWEVQVLPNGGAAELEIDAHATLVAEGRLKHDSIKGTLNSLLARNRAQVSEPVPERISAGLAQANALCAQ